jgi:LysR family glycine cleavage system transcriptional activator
MERTPDLPLDISSGPLPEHPGGGRPFPSTTALRIFLEVARCGSTARAASEVNLTQSAVSKQILALEAQIGTGLFERSAAGLRLTEAGEIFRPYALAAVEQIQRGMQRVRERGRDATPIRLHMIPIAGERWLMDRFPVFAARHPEVDVQFTNYISETFSEEPDITIRHGAGPWPAPACHYLFGREVSLIGAPAMLERVGGLKHPADVQGLTVLQHFLMPSFWAEFTEAAGLRGAVPARTIRYGYFSVIIQAALAGLGLALVPTCFIRAELADGRLENPLGLRFPSALGCWLTVTGARPAPEGLDALVGWMLEEARAFDAA